MLWQPLLATAASGLIILGAWLTRSEVRRARTRHGRHRRLPQTRNLPLRIVITQGCFALGAATLILAAFVSA
ncbi:hypothetical protein AB0L82_39115 [Nocardia sp. NPDC052001]|uniref:hypothetical protein n=1 Tax=Nocardia sp. NPDC052001 TaxID=3154853 RepID=UPI003417C714